MADAGGPGETALRAESSLSSASSTSAGQGLLVQIERRHTRGYARLSGRSVHTIKRKGISCRDSFGEASNDEAESGLYRRVWVTDGQRDRPLAEGEPDVATLLGRPEAAWITRDLEQRAQGYAIANVVPGHVKEVRDRRLAWIEKTRAAVKDRLTKEIAYWDHRAEQLKLQEQAGKAGARLNSQEARRRADELQARLERRLAELDREAQISALPPVVLGGVVIVPMGLLAKVMGSAAAWTRRQVRSGRVPL